MNRPYGYLIARMQPPHKGHMHLINQIIQADYTPVILLGSSNKHDQSNPYTFEQRKHMLDQIYIGLESIPLLDYPNWDDWLDQVISIVGNGTIFTHTKEEDRYNFTCRGKQYTNEFYTQLFTDVGIPTIQLANSNINVRATNIRDNFEANKQFLHHSTYSILKDNQ